MEGRLCPQWPFCQHRNTLTIMCYLLRYSSMLLCFLFSGVKVNSISMCCTTLIWFEARDLLVRGTIVTIHLIWNISLQGCREEVLRLPFRKSANLFVYYNVVPGTFK